MERASNFRFKAITKMNTDLKRCALYTRKSSEEGLDQEFNSLDASAKADIIASGFGPIENGKWRCSAVENTFDEGGFTTTMEVEALETPKS